MKNAASYKAAVYSGKSYDHDFWKGKAGDKQINSAESYIASYWIKDFLHSDFLTPGEEGTRRFASAVREAMKHSTDTKTKEEITAFCQLLPGLKGKIASAKGTIRVRDGIEDIESFPRRLQIQLYIAAGTITSWQARRFFRGLRYLDRFGFAAAEICGFGDRLHLFLGGSGFTRDTLRLEAAYIEFSHVIEDAGALLYHHATCADVLGLLSMSLDKTSAANNRALATAAGTLATWVGSKPVSAPPKAKIDR